MSKLYACHTVCKFTNVNKNTGIYIDVEPCKLDSDVRTFYMYVYAYMHAIQDDICKTRSGDNLGMNIYLNLDGMCSTF